VIASDSAGTVPLRLRCAVVLHVEEDACEVWRDGTVISVPFASQFPSPREKRVAPGHLVAVATATNGAEIVVWRWFDAVVLGDGARGAVSLWEPGHGEVLASPRPAYRRQAPGSRAYASAGLPGADWWVADGVTSRPEDADVELDAVEGLYTENGLWVAAFGQRA